MLSNTRIGQGVILFTLTAGIAAAQETKDASKWKTWAIRSGSDHAVPAPPGTGETRGELNWLREAAAETAPGIVKQIQFWDAGPPSYRWMELVARRQSNGESVGTFFVRAHTYVAMAIYDATVAAHTAKQTYQRARPSEADPAIRPRVAVPPSSSYPSDYAATAAAAAEVMAYLVPSEAAYFRSLAEEAAKSRLYAGVEYPSDYFAGMELGKRVAEQVILKARADGSDAVWTGAIPTGRCMWTGANPGNVTAAQWKPLLLTSPSEFRPAPPPSCESAETQAALAEVKNFPRALTTANLNTNAKALYWQTPEGIFPWALVHLNRWILEDKMERSPLRAARAYALLGAAGYDAFIASQDGKFAYWYLRPAQLDPTLTPLFQAPNFPSYPSNHSTFSAARSEVLAYLFPERAEFIRALGKEAGDSRIWAGIHFEFDNQAGVTLGRSVARKFVEWALNDGSEAR
ncbi:MAG: phosphatase PAP2 family protein [Bryobacterales bacterium]|nr:phosphatase PAP2 family protein [Bryobacterales bacterium]